MHFDPDSTAQQQQVLVFLAQGKTINAAAAAVGIHRNTIANWRRSSESFRKQWHNMQYEQAMHWRDELQAIAPVAIDVILKTLTDEKASPSVRLRAAIAVIDKVTALPPAQPDLKPSRNMHLMHNSAQSAQSPEPLPVEPLPNSPEIAHAAQSAQPCTIDAPRPSDHPPLFNNDQLDSLLEQMCTPPSMHNPAQWTAPREGAKSTT